MSALYFSRARLAAGRDRLGPILFPQDSARRMAVSHRLVWTLFPPDLAERPFLYRETAPSRLAHQDGRGEFYILSNIPPQDRENLFNLATRPFAPVLRPGDVLQFSLRANPTVQKSEEVAGRRKSRRHDVVMQALHALPPGKARADARPEAIRTAGLAWLDRQAAEAGFRLVDTEGLAIDGYEQFDADPDQRRAGRRRPRPVHSRLDFEGRLEVLDPERFLARLATGFGRARAFGHGLMLIRRA